MMHETTAVMTRATMDEIEAKRASALAAHGVAFDALAHAIEASAAAVQKGANGPRAAGAMLCEKLKWSDSGDVRAAYIEHARRDLDRSIWHFLIDFMGLEKVMDRTERDRFRAGLAENPIEATAANCAATFATLLADADTIFRRGIALAFSKLDRRFRSHDGFKIGGRIVLSYAMSESGHWTRSQDETLRDVERAFYQMDGKEQPDRMGGIIGTMAKVRSETGRGWGGEGYTAEDAYFRARVFKNGNVHIWFKRDDLTQKVNQLLAEYYGAALGAGADAAETRAAPKTGVAPRFGLFETPEALALQLMGEAGVHTAKTYHRGEYPRLRVLEPSAGKGRIAIPMRAAGHAVTCVELQSDLAEGLAGMGFRTAHGDFMEVTPALLGEAFDAVVMNPPFDRGRDVEHVMHAWEFLKPGCVLVSVMSSRVEFAEDKRTTDFRAFVERMKGEFRDLPPGSFAESGTNANTVTVRIRKPSA